ncbi:MAG: M56 family metallopeptidase, partial [Clostridia bacterium]|nr:M56 family metallopeptidase [Clostridia bacterium]
YLPFNMNEKDMAHVISHEQAHIHRKDHLWKPLGFLLLTLHWFNPLVWLGYILLCRDIELACDEKVVKVLDHDARADYSEALLACSVNRRMIAACPLAFGEVGVKERVKSVLHYKKPAFWIILTAILACIVLAICFLTSPIDKNNIGVKSISAKMVDSNIVELSIKCSFPSGGYSVRLVPENEGEYIGDGMIDYDGSLGKYRVMITFGDTDKSKDFVKQLTKNNNVLEFKNNSIKVKTAAPSDHGFVMYLGFDSPVTVDPITSSFKEKTIQCTIKIPIRILSNNLIYGFVPPASDSDKVSYVSIEDFGCDIPDVSVDFKDVLFGNNGQITFVMQWQNSSSNNIDIGPDFEVYKYNGSTLEKLEHRGIWLLYRLMLAGEGMNVADGIDVALFETKNTVSYDLSYHYNISKPGKYRLEAHGDWVDFQILGDGFVQKTEEMSYEKLTVDFPNADKHVFLEPRYSETFFVKNDTEWGGFYYHRYFKKCAECGKVLESTDVYRCQINHSLCEGDCIG